MPSLSPPRASTASGANERHFAPGAARDLKHHTISGTLVTLIAQGLMFVLTIGSTVLLARLLDPSDFGLIAMAMTAAAFLRAFKAAGLSSATIQRAHITQAQVSNLFWLNLTLGLAAGIALALCAPVVAWFFREPRLLGITLMLAITFPLEGATAQHLALLTRQMRFQLLGVIQVTATAVSIALAGILAWQHYGYWSLVTLQVAAAAGTFILTWFASGWRPSRPARRAGTWPLVTFGAHLSASTLVYSLAGAADSLLLGRFHGTAAVGLYNRAAALLRRPLDQMLAPVNSVFVPVLARLQSQPLRYGRAFLQVHDSIAVCSIGLSALSFALAPAFTGLVLGPAWKGAAPVVAGFAFSILATPLAATCSWLLETQGRGRDAVRLSLFSSVMAVIAFVIGLPWGAAGVAWAFGVSSLLVQLPLFYAIAGRTGPVSGEDLRQHFFRHAALWPCIALAAFVTRTVCSDSSYLLQFVLGSVAGVAAGAAFLFAHPPSRSLVFRMLNILREWRRGNTATVEEQLTAKSPA